MGYMLALFPGPKRRRRKGLVSAIHTCTNVHAGNEARYMHEYCTGLMVNYMAELHHGTIIHQCAAIGVPPLR